MKRRVSILLLIIIAMLISVFAIDRYISHTVTSQIYTVADDVPQKKVGLLLGTSKYLGGNRENLFYKYRIQATVALFKAGKIRYILISGDNSRKDYSEPEMMQADLIAMGIPKEKIFLDYAGFRTLDSIVRCKLVFDEDDIVIISQRFHNERALYLANSNNVKAIAYNAQDVPDNVGLKTMLREKLARTKMMLDLMLGKSPKYFGPKVEIK